MLRATLERQRRSTQELAHQVQRSNELVREARRLLGLAQDAPAQSQTSDREPR
jgi:hypothetical protein